MQCNRRQTKKKKKMEEKEKETKEVEEAGELRISRRFTIRTNG
jgi:hypothetical protein